MRHDRNENHRRDQPLHRPSPLRQGLQAERKLPKRGCLGAELIADPLNLGYTFDSRNWPEKLLANVRVQLQALNKVQFTDSEWLRFVETSLDRPGSQLKITRSISRRERRSQSPLEI